MLPEKSWFGKEALHIERTQILWKYFKLLETYVITVQTFRLRTSMKLISAWLSRFYEKDFS